MNELKRKITLLVKPTHDCNLNCPYCYDEAFRKKHKGERMPLEMIEKTINIFKGRLKIWTWHGGEPLIMGIDYLKKANKLIWSIDPDVRLAVQTNGTLINQEMIDMFKEFKITPGLSFDGLINDSTRRDTKELMKIFDLLEKNDIGFGCISLITPQNIDNIIQEYEYFKRLGVPVKMNVVFKASGNKNTSNIDGEYVADRIVDFFEYWIKDSDKPAPSKIIYEHLSALIDSGQRMCYNIDCLGSWFAVGPDGQIQPCGRGWDEIRTYTNINKIKSFEEIAQTSKYKQYQKEVKELFGSCAKCDFFYACQGGCFNNNYTVNGTAAKKDPNHCVFVKKLYTHMFNTIKNLDTNKIKKYNPHFTRILIDKGFRNIDYAKEIITNKIALAEERGATLNLK